jgi:hypothetical protein
MKSIIKKIIFFFAIIITSCSSEKSTKELDENFSKEEISELNKIIDYYKNEIEGKSNDEFEKIYNRQLDEIVKKGSNSKIYALDFNNQNQFYESLSAELFNEIWYYSEMGKVKFHKEYTIQITQFQTESKYQNFLSDVGKYNRHIKEYQNNIKNFGVDTTTWLEQTILMYPSDFNLSDPNIQLIISIHHLTQNDRNHRMEKLNNDIKKDNL